MMQVSRFLLLAAAGLVGTDATPVECMDENVRRLVGISWMQMKDQCASRDYTLVLRVEDHISLLAVPMEREMFDKSCASIQFHDGESGKEALMDDSELKEVHDGTLDNDEDLPLGVFNFADIASAFENAGESEPAYDIVDNNCATVVLNMLVELGIDTHGSVQHTSKQLFRNHRTINALRGSVRINEILKKAAVEDSAGGIEDSKLLELLVQHYVENHAKSATCTASVMNSPHGDDDVTRRSLQDVPSWFPVFPDSEVLRISVHVSSTVFALFEPVNASTTELHENAFIFQPCFGGNGDQTNIGQAVLVSELLSEFPALKSFLEETDHSYRFTETSFVLDEDPPPLNSTFAEVLQAISQHNQPWPGAHNVAFHNCIPRVLRVIEELGADLGTFEFQDFALKQFVLDGRVPDQVAADPVALRLLFPDDTDNELAQKTSFTRRGRRLESEEYAFDPRRGLQALSGDEAKKAVLVLALMKYTLASYSTQAQVVQSLIDLYDVPGDYDAQCGNGMVDYGEECDAGAANGSGESDCDKFCTLKNYWFCPDGFEPSNYNPYSCRPVDVNNPTKNKELCQTASVGAGHWELERPNECFFWPFWIRGYVYKPPGEFEDFQVGLTVEADGCDVACAKSKCLARGYSFLGKTGEFKGVPFYGCQYMPCFHGDVIGYHLDFVTASHWVCQATLGGTPNCGSDSCMEAVCRDSIQGSFSIQENDNGIDTYTCVVPLYPYFQPHDGYFCPPKYQPVQDEPFSCSIVDSETCGHSCAENYCKLLIEEGPIRTRSLSESLDNATNRELALSCDAGFLYDSSIHHCVEIDECSTGEFPCSSDPGSYCVDHFPPIRFECGCAKGFFPTGFPKATTFVNYNGQVVDAVIESIENEVGILYNYAIPVSFRPLGCEAELSPVPSNSPTRVSGKDTTLPSSSEGFTAGHCGNFGRRCDLGKETCGNYTKLNGTEVEACLCKPGLTKALNDPDDSLRGCVPIDKCAHTEWNWCGPHADCHDDLPGTAASVRCTCTEGYIGGGADCRATLSPSVAPVTPAPITSAPNLQPSPPPTPVPVRYRRRPGDTKYDPPDNTCRFTPCPFAFSFIYVSTSKESVVTCAMLTSRNSCDAECAKNACEFMGGTFTENGLSYWQEAHTCTRYYVPLVDVDALLNK